MHTISADMLRVMLAGPEEHALIDLRREGEFAQGHLFFASNVPRAFMELRIEHLIPRKETPIVIVDRGAYADDIGEAIGAFGYHNVSVLEGESAGWERAGGKLYSGLNVPSKAFGEFVEMTAKTPHIGPEDLKKRQDVGEVTVLDSRPLAEYQVMSIPGAINCPGAELLYRYSAIRPARDVTIVVNCAGRTRSIIGAQSLIDAGVSHDVVALRDGTMGWHLAGLPLDHGQNRFAPAPDASSLSEARAMAARHAGRCGVVSLTSEECESLRAREDGRTTYLFDVRDPLEYEAGHLRGAISAPGGQLIQTFDIFAPVRNARFILSDDDGVRAPMTAAWLRQTGISDVCTVSKIPCPTCDLPRAPRRDKLLNDCPTVALQEAAALVRDGRPLMDLGSSKDYRRIHIAGALFSEYHLLPDEAGRHGGSVLITSPDGRVGALAARHLREKGIDAKAIRGGTAAWIGAGLPTDSGPGNLPERPADVFYRPYDLTAAAESAMRDYLDWEKGLLQHVTKEPGIAFARPVLTDLPTSSTIA